MRRISSLLAAFCFALPAFSSEEVVNPTAKPIRPSVDAKISKDEILGHIKYLSSPELRGREAGSPEQHMTAQYIASEFKRYGLEPFGDEKNGKRDYLQEFQVKFSKAADETNVLRLKNYGGEFLHSLVLGQDFGPIPVGHKRIEGTGGIVFAGYGIIAPEYNYDDFAKVDLKGKWALILRYEPQEQDPKSVFNGKEHTRYSSLSSKITACAMRKAVGVMIVTGPLTKPEDDRLSDGSGQSIGKFDIPVMQITRVTADFLLRSSRLTLTQLQAAIDKDLTQHSFEIPNLEVHGASDLKYELRTTYNAIGILRGRDEKLREEAVIVGAHCDHVGMGSQNSLDGDAGRGKMHPGADDNASGTAGMLEIAQSFGSLPANERPARSVILMAFSGEEMGLLGSQHYCDHPSLPLNKTAAMLNLDMIGRSNAGGLQVSGLGTCKEFKDLVKKEAIDARVSLSYGRAGSGPSDHATFNAKKIPVLFFFTGTHPDYHRPGDTWDKINAPVAEAAADLARKMCFAVANDPKRYEYTDPGSGGGFMGISPDDKKLDAKGYAVASVVEDGPAAKAGLKAGDLITDINKQPIANASDLMMSLVDFGAGDEITVSYTRDKEKLECKVKLAERQRRRRN